MELRNVKITKIGNKDKPSAYLPIKRKVFVDNGLSFDKTYNIDILIEEVNDNNKVLDVVTDETQKE